MSHRAVSAITVVCLAIACALAAAPMEAEVQGMYRGAWKDGNAQGKLEARVVAWGGNTYKALITQERGGGGKASVELDGKLKGDKAVFEGKADGIEWEGVYGNGEIRGRIGKGGKFELTRVVPESPTAGKQPPEGAVVLLDGKDFSEMVRRGNNPWYVDLMSKDGWTVWEVPIRIITGGQPKEWPDEKKVVPEGWALGKERRRADSVIGIDADGSIRMPRGGMSTKRQFEGSFDLHVEFMCPLRAKARGQGRGNSGVYLPNGEEIQVLDSFGMTTYDGGGCGGIYRWKKPDTFDKFNLTCYPPLTWQTYDIEHRVRKDEKGKPAVYLTVTHNGVRIHNNVKLQRGPRKGGFHFQDHGNPVRYRNIWVLPVKEK